MLNIKNIIQTEKSNLLEKFGFYVFKISSHLKKEQIRFEIEKLFGVKVASINTANFKGKVQRVEDAEGPSGGGAPRTASP